MAEAGERRSQWLVHQDDGARYASKEFANVCRELGVTRSRGAVGTSADNAAAESYWSPSASSATAKLPASTS